MSRLHANDDALLEHCLGTTDKRVIEATVGGLAPRHVIPFLSNLSGADLLLMRALMRKTLARCEALSHGVVYDWLAMITLAFWLQRPRVLCRTVMLYV